VKSDVDCSAKSSVKAPTIPDVDSDVATVNGDAATIKSSEPGIDGLLNETLVKDDVDYVAKSHVEAAMGPDVDSDVATVNGDAATIKPSEPGIDGLNETVKDDVDYVAKSHVEAAMGPDVDSDLSTKAEVGDSSAKTVDQEVTDYVREQRQQSRQRKWRYPYPIASL
jgi:hypothetical protein